MSVASVGKNYKRTLYVQRLLEAVEDMENAVRGVYEFSHEVAVDKMLDCYFSLVTFELEFKTDYTNDSNGADPYQLLALHVMLVKLQFDIDDALMTINKNTIQSHVSVLKRLFTDNRAFGEVVSILDKVTRLNLISKTPNGGFEDLSTRSETTTVVSRLPVGLSRFDMTVAAGFDAIIGQDAAVDRIRRAVVRAGAVSQPLSLVLYGPPGTGKTSIALAIGREYKLNVYTIAVSSLGGHYVGERENNMVEIFDFLENSDEDVLLFVDEADSFLTNVSPNDSQQARYTNAVTVELFEKFLKPKPLAAGETISVQGKRRVLLLATNFVENIADEIARRSEKILIDVPRMESDMSRLVEYYRKANRVNMTERRLDRMVKYALMCGLAPSHVAQIMRRLSTRVLLDMLRRGVIVRRYDRISKSVRRPFGMLALPYYTVGGVAVAVRPSLKDTVVRVFNSKLDEDVTGIGERKVPLSRDGLYGVNELPASAVYPVYDGDIERFFRLFPGFRPPEDGDDSTRDPEYVEPDDGAKASVGRQKASDRIRTGLDPDELVGMW